MRVFGTADANEFKDARIEIGQGETPKTWKPIGAAANGLYTVAGVLLTLKTRTLPGWLRAWTWATWGAGFFLTAFTLADCTAGVVVSTALLMTLFCPWVALMGRALR